ncbi:CocE/NonD family hydrolase [Jiangella endophytica]|uniref:CocE/NonD family hydrolase n=1 Tax=Jiangella endophytica TaxID=1623398 RepID=UPI0018E52811|nr:CocE/NonD family hydrolase [Jiangella endophytica]
MRDGVVLRGDLWECARPTGLVLIRTPYEARQHASTARSWTARGFSCLVQDVRGRYRSAGRWLPYEHETADGEDVLRQLGTERPGLPVVLFGASYAAHTALEAARAGTTGPAAVIVLVPALGPAETARDSGGRPQIRHRIGWWHQHGIGSRSRPALHPGELDRRTEDAERRGVLAAVTEWGWPAEVVAAWERLWHADRVDIRTRYGQLRQPLLVVSGDEDFFRDDAELLAAGWGGPSHLVTGPWGHDLRARIAAAGGPGAAIDAWLAGSADTQRTRSVFDDAAGAWRHERTPT